MGTPMMIGVPIAHNDHCMQSLWGIIRSRQTLTLVIAGAFLFGAGLSLSLGMQSDLHGTMPGCPFMSAQPTVCQMGVLEHITKWQQLFTAVFPESDMRVSLVLLLLTIVILALFSRGSHRAFAARALSPPMPKIAPEAKFFNHLIVAFSEGILHPKIYA